MSWKVPLFKIFWDNDDIDAVTGIIKQGSFWAEGKTISQFEEKIADYFNVKHAVVFNSGTAALHSLLACYGIGQGDEVLVPSFTFISTANSVLFVEAKPVFVDIEDERYGIDPEKIVQAISKQTKAIIPVHYAGLPCKIDEIAKIAKEHDLIVIEDNAESFGATYNGKFSGTIGDSAFLSFCQNKIITTGEGGAAITNDEDLYNKLREFRSHGRTVTQVSYFDSVKKADYTNLGFNYRMPTMNAALGIAQLHKVQKLIDSRRKIASRYIDELQHIAGLSLPLKSILNEHVFQLFSLMVTDAADRNKLISHLADKGIMSKVYFDPIHKSDFYENKLHYNQTLEVTEEVSSKILSLPIYPEMPNDDISYVIKSIKEYFER